MKLYRPVRFKPTGMSLSPELNFRSSSPANSTAGNLLLLRRVSLFLRSFPPAPLPRPSCSFSRSAPSPPRLRRVPLHLCLLFSSVSFLLLLSISPLSPLATRSFLLSRESRDSPPNRASSVTLCLLRDSFFSAVLPPRLLLQPQLLLQKLHDLLLSDSTSVLLLLQPSPEAPPSKLQNRRNSSLLLRRRSSLQIRPGGATRFAEALDPAADPLTRV